MKIKLVFLAIVLAIGVLIGHNTNIYATHLNGGITVGSVGIELWGHPGIFVCTPGNC